MTKKPETVNEVDLIKRKDGLYYKKYIRGDPFTGKRIRHFTGEVWVEENWKKGKLHGDRKTYFEERMVFITKNMQRFLLPANENIFMATFTCLHKISKMEGEK